jgi:hypothetical protein
MTEDSPNASAVPLLPVDLAQAAYGICASRGQVTPVVCADDHA